MPTVSSAGTGRGGSPRHEDDDTVVIRLTAEDRGQPQRSSEVELRLTIVDVDDNGPVFELPRFVDNMTTIQ